MRRSRERKMQFSRSGVHVGAVSILVVLFSQVHTAWASDPPGAVTARADVPDTPSPTSDSAAANCAAAATANIIGYFDKHGFDKLIPDGKTVKDITDDLVKKPNIGTDPASVLQ